jgi:UDPglucose--hexose-1-phosphate uridylyltransferase
MLKCNSAFVFRECFVMPYNELRKDYLLNRWVVIATERGRRPTDFAKQKTENAMSAACPMCVGNESMTPPAVMLYLKDDNELRVAQDPPVGERPKNWLVRVVPNLFPAFTPPKQSQDTEQIFASESLGNAIGHHEVIIESPIHDEGPADAQLPQLELLIHAYIDRLREISSKPYVKHVSIFRNYGQQAGASLSHAHSQLIATPMVPPMIQEETDASEKFYAEHGRCIFCDIIEQEAKGPRLIYDNADLMVFAPYASINPVEFWIVPKKHAPNILDLSDGEVAAFAKTLNASLKALKELVNDPPYNYGFHLALSKDAEPYYHWHLEVQPKLSIWAGFEIATGIHINTVTPETAAKSLRETIKL